MDGEGQEMSSAVAWGIADARTQVVARMNRQRYRVIRSLTRGEQELGHQYQPMLRCYCSLISAPSPTESRLQRKRLAYGMVGLFK